MELEHSFTVPVPRDQAWDVLLDVKKVAPCMPGATLDSVDGDEIKGRIKVRVGPITMTYAGTAQFIERDPAAGVVTMRASGKETRGAGTASATVRSELHGQGDETQVTVRTSLNVTGRPAQFGRGVMADVSGKLIGIFAANLADMLAADGKPGGPAESPAAAAAASTAPASSAAASSAAAGPGGSSAAGQPAAAAGRPPQSADEAIDLLGVAGLPVLKRMIPVAAVLIVVVALLLRRRSRSRGAR